MSAAIPSGWEFHPFEGFGPIRFGQPRTEVHSLLGAPSKTFRKAPFVPTETDAYDLLGLHVYYEDDGFNLRVECIEAMEPAVVSLSGVAVLGRRSEDVANELSSLDHQHDSLIFSDSGFALYEEDGIVKCVTLFPRGYYDLSNRDSPASRAMAAAAAWYAGRKKGNSNP